MQLYHTIMAHTSKRPFHIFLLHLSISTVLYSIVRINNRIHFFLGKMGIYALARHRITRHYNAGNNDIIQKLPLYAQTPFIRNRLVRRPHVGTDIIMYHFHLRLWRTL